MENHLQSPALRELGNIPKVERRALDLLRGRPVQQIRYEWLWR